MPAKTVALGLDRPAIAFGKQSAADRGGAVADQRHDGVGVAKRGQGGTRLEDAGLLPCDALYGVRWDAIFRRKQECLVIDTERCNAADGGRGDDVCGVEAAAETDFEQQQVLGYAPVEPDGSFKLQVPADTPLALVSGSRDVSRQSGPSCGA